MTCEGGAVLGKSNTIDLEKELINNNARIMAVQTGNILDQVGGQVQFGKRQDLFWIIMTVILGAVLVFTQVFKKRKRRR